MCHVEMKQAGCEELANKQPQLIKENKLRNCETEPVCETTTSLSDYTKACVSNWAGAWGDLAKALWHLLLNDPKMSPEIAEREKFFAECTTVQCKREMLGPYADLFSKEEIEGNPYDRNVMNAQDPMNANHLQGLSAKVLYQKLRERLFQKMKTGTLDQPPLDPWSKKPMQPLPSIDAMIEKVLQKAGVSHGACYDPVVLWEMRCYALFTVLDPLLVAGGISKIARLAGTTAKVEGSIQLRATMLVDQKPAAALKHAVKYLDEDIAETAASARSSIAKADAANSTSTKFWKDVGVEIKGDGRINLDSTKVAQNVDSKVTDLIQQKKVKDTETLRPVFAYKYKNEIIGISPNDIPPVGAERLKGSVLDKEDFYKFASEGMYPMGTDTTVRVPGFSGGEAGFLHDLNHFAIFTDNPQFMAGSRKAATKIRNTTDPALRETLARRYDFASEYSSAYPKEKLETAKSDIESIKSQLKLPTKSPGTFQAYKNALEKLNPDQLKAIIEQTHNSAFTNAQPQPLGGGESMLQHQYPPDPAMYFNWPIDPSTTTHKTQGFSQGTKYKPTENATQRASDIEKVAEHLEKADAFLKIRPQDWMNEGTAGANLPPMGNTTRFCKSRGIDKTGKFYQMYCL